MYPVFMKSLMSLGSCTMIEKQPIIDRFNGVFENAQIFCFITRSAELQREACDKLKGLLIECDQLKAVAVTAGAEDFANLLLGFECVADCLLAEIEMWLLIKEEKPDEAWDRLVSAQNAVSAAARAHKGFEHLEKRAEYLAEVEKIVFPPQNFVSAGLHVRHQICSICGRKYGDCDNLVGRPYWGRFCSIITRGIEANHIALVKEPADKGCRVTHFAVEGGSRNKMTWQIEQDDLVTGQVVPDQPGLIVKARVLRASHRAKRSEAGERE
jgi:hypothetical protein